MPRTARASAGGYCYHVINRGNAQRVIFHSDSDYRAFLALIVQACRRLPLRVLAYCLMPNHFHLALWPYADNDLSRWMQWLLTAHVRRYHHHYASSGHVWQGRFKAFPIQSDRHLLTVLRYIERNPVRAGLVTRADEWTWSSFQERCGLSSRQLLHPCPYPIAGSWRSLVNEPLTVEELIRIRQSVNRERPFGEVSWETQAAQCLGLEATLRPRGRPPKRGHSTFPRDIPDDRRSEPAFHFPEK
jgi:putative transposase